MALTQEQINSYRQQYGISAPSASSAPTAPVNKVTGDALIQQLKSSIAPAQPSRSLPQQREESTAQTRQDEQIAGRQSQIQDFQNQLEDPRFSDESIREERKETIKGLPRLFGKKTETEKERDDLEQKIGGNRFMNTAQTFLGTKGLNLTAPAEGVGRALENVAGAISPKFDSRSELLQQRNESQAQQFDSVIEQMQAARASGDMERYELLKQEMLIPLANESNLLASEADEFIDRDPSNKEIIGGAVSAATLAASGGLSAGGTSLATRALPSLAKPATSILGGAAKTAARNLPAALGIGFGEGTGRGITQEKNVGGVIGQGVKESAIAGLASSVVSGGVGAFQARQALKPQKQTEELLDFIQKKRLTNTESQFAREQGRVTSPTKLKSEQLIPTTEEVGMVEAARGVVDPKAPLQTNVKNIKNRIIEDSKKVDDLFDKETIKGLSEERIDDAVEALKESSSGKILFTPGTSEEKAYDALFDVYKDELRKAGGNPIVARRNFDAIAKQRLPNAFKRLSTDSITNVKEQAFMDIRGLANDLAIETLTPSAGEEVVALLRNQTSLHRIRTNLALNSMGITKLKPSKLKALLKNQWVKVALAAVGGSAITGAVIGS
jgi:hypothetical protein